MVISQEISFLLHHFQPELTGAQKRYTLLSGIIVLAQPHTNCALDPQLVVAFLRAEPHVDLGPHIQNLAVRPLRLSEQKNLWQLYFGVDPQRAVGRLLRHIRDRSRLLDGRLFDGCLGRRADGLHGDLVQLEDVRQTQIDFQVVDVKAQLGVAVGRCLVNEVDEVFARVQRHEHFFFGQVGVGPRVFEAEGAHVEEGLPKASRMLQVFEVDLADSEQTEVELFDRVRIGLAGLFAHSELDELDRDLIQQDMQLQGNLLP